VIRLEVIKENSHCYLLSNLGFTKLLDLEPAGRGDAEIGINTLAVGLPIDAGVSSTCCCVTPFGQVNLICW